MRTFGIPRNLGSSSTGKKMRTLGIPRNLGSSSTGKKIGTFGIPIILGSSATGKKVITSGIPRTLGMRFFWNYVFVLWFLCWLRKSPLWNPGGYKKVLELWLSPKCVFSLKNVFFWGGNSWGVVTSSRMTWSAVSRVFVCFVVCACTACAPMFAIQFRCCDPWLPRGRGAEILNAGVVLSQVFWLRLWMEHNLCAHPQFLVNRVDTNNCGCNHVKLCARQCFVHLDGWSWFILSMFLSAFLIQFCACRVCFDSSLDGSSLWPAGSQS